MDTDPEVVAPCESCAVKLTVKVWPACDEDGVKLNCPWIGLPVAGFGVKLAFGGMLDAVRVTLSPASRSEADTAKLSVLPICTNCGPGTFRAGGVFTAEAVKFTLLEADAITW